MSNAIVASAFNAGVGAARAFVRLAALGGCLALLLGALLGPPWAHDGRALLRKLGQAQAVEGRDVRAALELLLGTGQPALQAALAAAALLGLAALGRRAPGASGLLLLLGLAQILLFRLAAPARLDQSGRHRA